METDGTQSKADAIAERYRQSKIRRNRRTNFWLMLAAFVGMVATGAAFVFFLTQRVISMPMLSLAFLCLVAFISGLIGWIRGGHSVSGFFDSLDH
jgi:fatty acid desaturase